MPPLAEVLERICKGTVMVVPGIVFFMAIVENSYHTEEVLVRHAQPVLFFMWCSLCQSWSSCWLCEKASRGYVWLFCLPQDSCLLRHKGQFLCLYLWCRFPWAVMKSGLISYFTSSNEKLPTSPQWKLGKPIYSPKHFLARSVGFEVLVYCLRLLARGLTDTSPSRAVMWQLVPKNLPLTYKSMLLFHVGCALAGRFTLETGRPVLHFKIKHVPLVQWDFWLSSCEANSCWVQVHKLLTQNLVLFIMKESVTTVQVPWVSSVKKKTMTFIVYLLKQRL